MSLSLVRDAVAKCEAQAHGLYVADITIRSELSPIALRARRDEPAAAAIFELVRAIFGLQSEASPLGRAPSQPP